MSWPSPQYYTGTYGIRQKECNKRGAAALENAAPCALLFSHSVCCTLMGVLSCKAPQFKDCGTFCRENAALLPNCNMFGKNRGVFGKTRRNSVFGASLTNPEETIKVQHIVLSDCGAQILQIVAFFFKYTVYGIMKNYAFGG